MNQIVAQDQARGAPTERKSLIAAMANRYHMEPKVFADTLKGTVVPGNVTNEQFAAFLLVAWEYGLNPVTKEIYAFPAKGGGIQPIVSIDGWMKMANNHPQFDGMEFEDTFGDDGKLIAVECRIYRKDRSRPVCVIEYMAECMRGTDPWKQWPSRMLRHKAAIQCARYAFGFSGVMEPDEWERMKDVTPERKPLSERLTASKPAGGEQPSEGFSVDHIDRETGEIRDGEYETVGGPQDRQAGPSDEPGEDMDSPSDASPGDDTGESGGDPTWEPDRIAEPRTHEGLGLFRLLNEEGVNSLPADERETLCLLCDDLATDDLKAAVDARIKSYAATLNGLSVVGKRLARGAQQARIAQIDGEV